MAHHRQHGMLGSSDGWYNERDTNLNGRLEYGEIERGRGGGSRQMYDNVDTNADGHLSREEGASYLRKAREAEAYAAKMRREAESLDAQRSRSQGPSYGASQGPSYGSPSNGGRNTFASPSGRQSSNASNGSSYNGGPSYGAPQGIRQSSNARSDYDDYDGGRGQYDRRAQSEADGRRREAAERELAADRRRQLEDDARDLARREMESKALMKSRREAEERSRQERELADARMRAQREVEDRAREMARREAELEAQRAREILEQKERVRRERDAQEQARASREAEERARQQSKRDDEERARRDYAESQRREIVRLDQEAKAEAVARRVADVQAQREAEIRARDPYAYGTSSQARASWDTNGDGQMSFAETRGQMSREAYNSYDTDNDGQLSRAEIQAGNAKRAAAQKAAPQKSISGLDGLSSHTSLNGRQASSGYSTVPSFGAAQGAPIKKVHGTGFGFNDIDTNGDGVLSYAEAGLSRKDFSALDRNGDGRISRSEVTAYSTAANRSQMQRGFENVDSNRDGKLSYEEAQRGMGWTKGQFDRVDSRQDGFVSIKEAEALAKRKDQESREKTAQMMEKANIDAARLSAEDKRMQEILISTAAFAGQASNARPEKKVKKSWVQTLRKGLGFKTDSDQGQTANFSAALGVKGEGAASAAAAGAWKVTGARERIVALKRFQAPPDSDFSSCAKGDVFDVRERFDDGTIACVWKNGPPCGISKLLPAYLFAEPSKVIKETQPKPKDLDGYHVKVYTGTVNAAGTDANVFINLCGTRNVSGEQQLMNSQGKKTFEKGSVDLFTIYAPNIGDIEQISIRHDNSGRNADWFLSKIHVQTINTGVVVAFDCEQWLSKSQGDKKIMRVLQKQGDYAYTVKVVTGKVGGAGTDSRVFVSLFGRVGNSGEKPLLKAAGSNVNLFEKGQTDSFLVQVRNLGDLEKIQVRMDNSGALSAWFLDYIEVTDNQTRVMSKFPCQQWFDKSNGDRKIERMLEKEGAFIYTVRVYTGTKSNAGTDSKVSISLFGESGQSIGQVLSKSQNKNPFEKGKMDEFSVKTTNLGNLKQLEVWHDNTGTNAGWFLNRIEVVAKEKLSTFSCQQWLDRSNGDGQIRRMLEKEGDAVYKLRVYTGTASGAGTNSKVSISLFGDKGQTIGQVLSISETNKDPFETGAMDQFRIDTNDLGNLSALEVWHDNEGMNSAWFLDKIEVEWKGKNTLFLCQQWLDKKKGDKLIRRMLQKEGDFAYTVRVYTGNKSGAGTNSKVSISLFGDKGQTIGEVLFSSENNKNPFEKGFMDQFTVNANDLGNLNQLEVWHDNSGLNAGWYLDKIEVEAKGIKSVFLCEQWLDKSNGDKQIKRILQKEGDFSYTLIVKTGNVPGGGTNAKVFVNLFGSKGESGNQQLSAVRGGDKDPFEQGSTDEFELHTRDVGELRELRVFMDSSGALAPWFLEQITVQTKKPVVVSVFPCHSWFDKNSGDKQTDRYLSKEGPCAYTVRVFTGTRLRAGTNSKVSIDIQGQRQSGPKVLANGQKPDGSPLKDPFENGHEDVFIVRTDDLGVLNSLKVWHDNSKDGWFLDKIEVEFKGKKSVFLCQQWLAVDEGDKEIQRELRKEGDFAYVVSLLTGNDGSNANFFVNLFGKKSKSGKKALLPLLCCDPKEKDGKNKDPFEQHSTDKFEIYADQDLGDLDVLQVGHDNSGMQPDWFCESVHVFAIATGKSYNFPCKQLFSSKKGDKLIQRDLTVEGAFSYTVRVKTGGDGTNSKVMISLFNAAGVSSGSVVLAKSVLNGDPFEANELDEFTVNTSNLGEIVKIELLSDGTNYRPDWKLDYVEVASTASPKVCWKFACDQLFSPKKGLKHSFTKEGAFSYIVRFTTGKENLAGTDGNVSINLMGSKAHSGTKQLVSCIEARNPFENGNTDSFVVNTTNLGDIGSIKVTLEGGDAWLPVAVEVEDPTRNVFKFTNKDWFSKSAGREKILTRIGAKASTTTKYTVTVVTGSVKSAGTDAKVSCQIYGTKGDSGPQNLLESLQNGKSDKLFETGETDTFIVETTDLGVIEKVDVWHNDSGLGSDWFLSYLEVSIGQDLYRFPCEQWLTKSKGLRKSLKKEVGKSAYENEVIYGNEDDEVLYGDTTVYRPVTSYLVRTVTGTESGAGTDANVFVQVFGSLGDSGELALENSQERKNPFEDGKTDSFAFNLPLLGVVDRVKVWHDDAKMGSAWFLARIELVNTATREITSFPGAEGKSGVWISKKEGLTKVLHSDARR